MLCGLHGWESVIGPQNQVQYVFDGRAMIHRIPWPMGMSWDELFSLYMQCVVSRYGKCVVVFDGYSNASTTKNCHTSQVKWWECWGCSTLHWWQDSIDKKINSFATRKTSNGSFACLQTNWNKVHQAGGGAMSSRSRQLLFAQMNRTTFWLEMTLICLCYFVFMPTMHSTVSVFRPESREQPQRPSKWWNIKATRARLGGIVCNNILFICAVLGCDTTSRAFGIGESVALTKIRKESHFLEQEQVFMRGSISQKKVIKAGEQALVWLYNGEVGEDVNKLRMRRWYDKTMSSTITVQPHTHTLQCNKILQPMGWREV